MCFSASLVCTLSPGGMKVREQVAGQQIRGGQLHVVPGVRLQDREHVILDFWQQVMGFKNWKREGVQPEESQQ